MSAGETCDLVVLGSGASGLTAALTAALEGLRVIVLECSPCIGGTTARSSGTVWIPDNPYQRAIGAPDDAALAGRYLDALVGERAAPAMRHAFLDTGPAMIADLRDRAGIRFRPYLSAPDYRQDLPGAAMGGRPLEPLPFDGRILGPDFARLGWPLRELMLFGGMMVTRGEAAQLTGRDGAMRALRTGAALVARYAADRLAHARGTRLVLGNALVASLFAALGARQVEVRCNARVQRLVISAGEVTGVELDAGGSAHRLRAARGVVLAGGGFPANADWRQRHLPAPTPAYTPAFEGCTGSTLALALGAGAALGRGSHDNALWFPSSIARRGDSSTAVYPHIVLDRAKPGLIAVGAGGRRFVNEAVSYHEFTRAMYRAHAAAPCIPAWLVCDRRFVWKYGLGMIRPRTPLLGGFVRRAYLHVAPSLRQLAAAIGVDATALEQTVGRHNQAAAAGHDDEFGKGGNAYDRSNGDPDHGPNPCLGPIDRPPYCAVAVVPTPLGTSLGLRATPDGQVLNADGAVMPGLYVCGNDMDSPFGGEYPGAGAQLGSGMTFAWRAARHAARR